MTDAAESGSFIMQNPKMKVTFQNEIEAKIISTHDWDSIKTSLANIKVKKGLRGFLQSFCWKDLGMVFLGSGIAIFTTLHIEKIQNQSGWNFVAATAIVFAIILVIVDYQFKETDSEKLNNVSNIIDLVEKNRF